MKAESEAEISHHMTDCSRTTPFFRFDKSYRGSDGRALVEAEHSLPRYILLGRIISIIA